MLPTFPRFGFQKSFKNPVYYANKPTNIGVGDTIILFTRAYVNCICTNAYGMRTNITLQVGNAGASRTGKYKIRCHRFSSSHNEFRVGRENFLKRSI